jgi:hypothetical protein
MSDRCAEVTGLQFQAVIAMFSSLELGFELPVELLFMGLDNFKLREM